jgi:hypothetical protein
MKVKVHDFMVGARSKMRCGVHAPCVRVLHVPTEGGDRAPPSAYSRRPQCPMRVRHPRDPYKQRPVRECRPPKQTYAGTVTITPGPGLNLVLGPNGAAFRLDAWLACARCRAAVLCAVMCHAVPCRAMLCHAVPCHAVPCCAMLCHAVPCRAMLCCAVPCCAVLYVCTRPGKRRPCTPCRHRQVVSRVRDVRGTGGQHEGEGA